MNKQQSALNNLQELVQFVNDEINSQDSRANLDEVEMLQDKFDALLQIIEAQAHRASILVILRRQREECRPAGRR